MRNIPSIHLLSRIATEFKYITKIMFSNRYLLLTNLGISVTLSGTGDMLVQHYDIITRKQDNLDVIRTRNMSLSGLAVGAVCHYWYLWLDRRLPGRTLGIVCKKVIVDQLVLSPVIISLFFVTVGVLEGSKPKDIGLEIIHKGKQLYLAEWFIWPVAQVLNFAFLPTRFRVLYDNTISLGFDVYTSYVKHKTEIPKAIDETNSQISLRRYSIES